MFALERLELCVQLFLQEFCHHLAIPLRQNARKVELAVNTIRIVSQIAVRKVITNAHQKSHGPQQNVLNVLITLHHS